MPGITACRLGALVHYLDVGGIPVSEAVGFAAILAGAKARCADDDGLLAEAGKVLEHLYAGYSEERNSGASHSDV